MLNHHSSDDISNFKRLAYFGTLTDFCNCLTVHNFNYISKKIISVVKKIELVGGLRGRVS